MRKSIIFAAVVVAYLGLLFAVGANAAPSQTKSGLVPIVNANAYLSAFDLQTACFGEDMEQTQAYCLTYAAGAIDVVYASFAIKGTACPATLSMAEFVEKLAFVFANTPDANLKQTTASTAILAALGLTDAGKLCFGGGGTEL